MKKCLLRFCVAALVLLAVGPTNGGPPSLQVEEFSREPDVAHARLSPEGKFLAYLREHEGRATLHVAEIGSNRVTRLDLGGAGLANGAAKEVLGFEWVSENRLIVKTGVWDAVYGVIAVDRTGAHEVPISGNETVRTDALVVRDDRLGATEVIHRFFDKDQTVLMLDRHLTGGGGTNRPDVIRVNTTDGIWSVEMKNPGNVSEWGVDNHGVVRLGILSHGALKGAICRLDEKSPWKTILPLQDRNGQMRPVGFDAATHKLLVVDLNENKRWTIFPLDTETGEKGAAILADPEYDILPAHFIPGMDGLALAAPIFSWKRDAFLGVRFVTDAPRVKWFDPEFALYQKAVDKALPDTVNVFVNASLNEHRLLWFAFSDQRPGTYYLLDTEQHTFKPVAPRMSWINPAQMAPMLAINYKARDGLVIHGFLTVPMGAKPQNLPLVVMPHGGPWVRDVWGFDPLVQLLANRGYAVLQINYRGSPGYGEELYLEARRQIGGKIQDDIEDATRWAIAAGVADPKRVAIFGASYGGYSALYALGRNPELYRCGISFAGVTDWPAIYTDSDIAERRMAQKYWREQIGDPLKENDRLRAASPVYFAEKIVAPVLILQGKKDERVPQDQATRMIAALEAAGHKPESRFISNLGHTYGRERDRAEIFGTIVAFLEKNLGGPAKSAATPP